MHPRKINLNLASKEKLELLPHIGPKRAEKIIAFRRSYGWFSDPADLILVPGIGPGIVDQIKDYVIC
jgi:competence protein ComEA